MSKPRLVLTCGDPSGVGPEILLRALSRPAVRTLASFLLLGCPQTLHAVRERLGLRVPWKAIDSAEKAFSKTVTVWNPGAPRDKPFPPGAWSMASGAASFAWVCAGIDLCLDGDADALVTGPICKAAWKAAGADYPGHTELLAEKTGAKQEVMMLAGGGLRVALVTVHEPLRRVPDLVTVDRIVSVGRILGRDLRRYFGLKKPRVAVLGLNPHAGEEGVIGKEDGEAIGPAVARLRRSRIDAVGPVPADTAFHHARHGAYDAILAMYHDQGLGPLKTVAFDSGVNITLGLPILRTSVDHGTAFDIAGRGLASPASCIEAIRMAVRMHGGKGKSSGS